LDRLVNESAADQAHGLAGATPILALDMYEHAYHLDFGAKAAAYVDQVMVNLNWERIGARYRLATCKGAREGELFLPFGAPAQQEARISAEELKTASRIKIIADRYSWMFACPRTCPGAEICCRVPPCTLLPRYHTGSRSCHGIVALWFIAFADFRSAAPP
jgi:hypothetical protein